MKVNYLKIQGFRGLDFYHSFQDGGFSIVTGINGSGKSTIIDVINTLLTKPLNQINEPFAAQATSEKAIFKIELQTNEKEIKHLAEKIFRNKRGQIDKEQLVQDLSKLFPDNKLIREIEIAKPKLGWSNRRKDCVNERVNENESSIDDLIGMDGQFNVIAQEILIRLENIQNINLRYATSTSTIFSIQNVFNTQHDNEQQRSYKMNVETGNLLQSLLSYKQIDDSKIKELIDEFNYVLPEIDFDIRGEENGMSSIVMSRNGKDYHLIDSASSGQKKAIVLAILKYLWNELELKPVVLIDEPENSMHPGMTSRVFNQLNDLMNDLGDATFIIATHSAEVVASSPSNTFRIVTDDKGTSGLKVIQGLESRAEVLEELGVHFHLDYVAQNIVFVESVRGRGGGELSDEEAYQRLIDPRKEKVLFVSMGSRGQAEKQYEFQKELYERLKAASSGLVQLLTDKDDGEYEKTKRTPFKHIEYVYLSNEEALTSAINEMEIIDQKVSLSDVKDLLKEQSEHIKNEDYKLAWENILKAYPKIKNKSKGVLQGRILDHIRKDKDKRTELVEKLFSRFLNSKDEGSS